MSVLNPQEIVPEFDLSQPGKLLPAERGAVMVRLFVAGMSYSQIGEVLGVTKNVVAGVLHREGVKRAPVVKKTSERPAGRPRTYEPRAKPAAVVAPPPPPPAPVVAPRLPEPTPIRPGTLTILEVPFFGRCKFPLWGFREKSGFVCGEAAGDGQVYCETHLAICSAGVTAKQDMRRTRGAAA